MGLKKPWNKESEELIISTFGERYRKKDKIDGKEISRVIEMSPCLQGRDTAQVRSFLQHRIRKKVLYEDSADINSQIINSASKIPQRNRIPNNIYLHFNEYIKRGEIPSVENCTEKYGKSPSLNKFSPRDIQDLVQKAIEFCAAPANMSNSGNSYTY